MSILSYLGFKKNNTQTRGIIESAPKDIQKDIYNMSDEGKAEANKKTLLSDKTPARPADPNVPVENMASLATAAMKAMGKDPDEDKKKKKK
jgi:hypothetical protein